MEDKEAIAVLKALLETEKLNPSEREAVAVAVGALSLMVHTSEGYINQLKAKKGRQGVE